METKDVYGNLENKIMDAVLDYQTEIINKQTLLDRISRLVDEPLVQE